MEEDKGTATESEAGETGKDDSGVTEAPQSRPIKDWLLEPAVIIALISGFAYLCAYIYEIGYCNYFGVPYDLIVINWTRFLISIFPFSAVLLAFLIPGIVKRFRRLSFMTLIVLVALSTYFPFRYRPFQWDALVMFSPFLVLMIIGVIGSIVFFILEKTGHLTKETRWKEDELNRMIQGWKNKRVNIITFILIFGSTVFICWIYYRILLDKTWQWDVLILAFSLIVMIYSWIKILASSKSELSQDKQESRRLFLAAVAIIGVFIFFWLSIGAGRDAAKTENEYLVTNSNQSMVVLRIYGDNAICAPWYVDSQSGNYTTKDFVLIPLENITLAPMEIGPLHVK